MSSLTVIHFRAPNPKKEEASSLEHLRTCSGAARGLSTRDAARRDATRAVSIARRITRDVMAVAIADDGSVLP